MKYLGEILALATAIGWATSSLFFEKASKRATGLSANFLKLLFLLIILSTITFTTRGMILPYDATPHMKFFLGLSGVIGLFVGDFFLFRAYIEIGARKSLLFSTLGPIVVTMLGFIFLKENLVFMQILAVMVICTGIFIVVSKSEGDGNKKISLKGVTFIIIAIFMDSVGIILTKIGSDGYNSFAASEVRTIPALIAFMLLITFKKRWHHVIDAINDRKSMKYIFFGTIFAAMGICAMVEAMKYAKIGVVSTLAGLSPVLVIPITVFILKEKVKKIELIGAVISCVGVGLLFI